VPAEAPAEDSNRASPAEEAAAAVADDGEDEAVPEDPWASVRISNAYDYAKCLQCGKKNEIRAESCARCGYELPQPSPLMTDPAYVFVPARGYYPQGTLLEAGKSRKGLWATGLILTVCGAATLVGFAVGLSASSESPGWTVVLVVPGFVALGTGVVLTTVGFATRSEPVYARGSGTGGLVAGARKAPGPLAVDVKIEVPVLSF
jgi:hypothetical protein